MRRYNLHFPATTCHYLIADAAGKTAVVEFLDGRVEVTGTDEPWQVSTNDRLSGKYRGRERPGVLAIPHGLGPRRRARRQPRRSGHARRHGLGLRQGLDDVDERLQPHHRRVRNRLPSPLRRRLPRPAAPCRRPRRKPGGWLFLWCSRPGCLGRRDARTTTLSRTDTTDSAAGPRRGSRAEGSRWIGSGTEGSFPGRGTRRLACRGPFAG